MQWGNEVYMANTRRFLKRGILAFGLLALIAVLAFHIVSDRGRRGLAQGFAKGNGRMEATEVDIATKIPGRLAEVLVKEGDLAQKGQVVARMDTSALDAQLRQAQAEVARLKQTRLTALSRVESIRLRLVLAGKELERSRQLHAQGIVAQQQYDRDLTARQTLQADHVAAQSAVAEVDAAITAAQAQAERLQVEISDCMLKSPISGPVLTRLAEPGEVLPAGGKVLTVVDPTDIYMNVYLSDNLAGVVPLGAEAKVVLDAIPDRPFAARVAYVSEKAQFTPKEVEAVEERQKLVFRVTVSFTEYGDPRLKPGMPGTAYIRFDPAAKWPDNLQ